MTSAYAPGAITPISPDIPSNSPPFDVAAWIAAIGVIPNSTIRENSRAIGSLQENPPTSVPNAILTPAFSALRNDGPWTATRLRSRFPAGESAGAQWS